MMWPNASIDDNLINALLCIEISGILGICVLCVYESIIFRPQLEKQNFYYLANTILCCWLKALLRPLVSVKIFFTLFIFKNVSEIII